MTLFCYRFFHFDNSENQDATNALYKIPANTLSGSGGKFDFIGLAIF